MLAARPKQVLSSTEAAAPPEELPDLYGFVPRLGRTYSEPRHLDPLVRQLEAAWTRSVYQTACAPPRHAKTDTVLAWAALTLRRQPWRTIAYISYEAHIARSKSRKARQWALAAGVQLADDAQALTEWRTKEGGGFLSGGIGGPLTSQGVDILLIDDPYKNRQQAESVAYRRMVTDWWGDVGETRIEPGGSAFIFHTRWTTDDLIAHVEAEGAGIFEPHIRLPAIDDAGRALWPDRWPVDALERKRKLVAEMAWASLYQGLPRPRGGNVFNGTHLHHGLDRWDNIVIGVDFAYSTRKSADHSVAVVLAEFEGKFYVLEVLRRQVPAPVFRSALRLLWAKWDEPTIYAYIGGTELGIADFVAQGTGDEEPLHIIAIPAKADKLVRAQSTAADWNAGRVLVPASGDDVDQFTGVVLGFTGTPGEKDDDVDALVAARDALSAAVPYDSSRSSRRR